MRGSPQRIRRIEAESVQQQRGVGEQSDTGCPHSDDELPCWECFDGGDADD